MTRGPSEGTPGQVPNSGVPVRFPTCNLFQLRLRQVVAHDGVGFIRASRIATRDDLASDCNYLDYVELPPRTSIGDHRHADDEEEFYLMLRGRGVMRLDAATFDVTAGDLIRNRPGGLHGLVNAGDEHLCLFVFELTARAKHET